MAGLGTQNLKMDILLFALDRGSTQQGQKFATADPAGASEDRGEAEEINVWTIANSGCELK